MKKKLVIERTDTIRRKVYSHLRAQILSGEYAPQERLFETKISDEIGASRTPVREALHSLELEGLIECLPKVGYVVKSISDQEVAEICEIRGLIEGLAARWAVEKAREKLIEELKKNIVVSETKTTQGVAHVYATDNVVRAIEGHKGILEALEKGEAEEINQAIRRHLEQSKKDILRYAFKENEAKAENNNMKVSRS